MSERARHTGDGVARRKAHQERQRDEREQREEADRAAGTALPPEEGGVELVSADDVLKGVAECVEGCGRDRPELHAAAEAGAEGKAAAAAAGSRRSVGRERERGWHGWAPRGGGGDSRGHREAVSGDARQRVDARGVGLGVGAHRRRGRD